jgi:tetraacyldisaccharide-1-P 4'-kinase
VGFARGFKNSIEKSGVKLSGSFELRDHNGFKSGEIEKVINKIEAGAYLAVTAKDAVKIEQASSEKIKSRIAVLNVKPEFESGKQLWEKACGFFNK